MNTDDNQPDADPATVDELVRDWLNNIDPVATAVPPNADPATEIAHAITIGWPDGHPPTLDELAEDTHMALGDAADIPQDAGHTDPHHQVDEAHHFDTQWNDPSNPHHLTDDQHHADDLHPDHDIPW